MLRTRLQLMAINRRNNRYTTKKHTKMKKLSTIITLLMSVLLLPFATSCSDDDETKLAEEDFVVSTAEIVFDEAGGAQTLYVKGDKSATVSTDATWLTITERESESRVMQVFNIEAGTTAENRSATITVTCAGYTKTVSVSQSGTDPVIVPGAQHSFDVPATSTTVTVRLVNNLAHEVSTDADWIYTTGEVYALDDAYAQDLVVYTNNTTSARTATVTFTVNGHSESISINQAAGTQPTIEGNALTIAPLMVPGWNLGNTMEGNNTPEGENYLYTNNVGLSGETSWQGTPTTQRIINYVKAQGFRSVRIPCNWMNGHITDAANYTIDPEWMNRVKEIVDYCINADLYVVLNDHYDGGWIESSFTSLDEGTVAANIDRLQKMWTQIANAFIDYDEHLLFAGLNEPACSNQAQTDVLLRYEQAFIDAVRATGGNNARRVLVVQGPSTDIDNTDNYFDVTRLNDSAENALMVEVHYYNPPQFSGVWENGNPYYFWGTDNLVSGSANNSNSGEDYMLSQFRKMKAKFFDKGYPVLLGEFGANWRSIGTNQDKHNASIKLYHQLAVQYGMQCGMVPMVWDINVASQGGSAGVMTIINRNSCSVFGTYAMEGITEGAAAGQWPQ